MHRREVQKVFSRLLRRVRTNFTSESTTACSGLTKRLITALVVTIRGTPVLAQSVQFVPETDAHLTLNSSLRAYLQAKDDRDEGVSDQFNIGPSAQFYLKPLIRSKRITAFDLDDSKPAPLVLEAGYRCITAPNAPPTHRMETALTSHFPLMAGFLLSDRNRADLDWKSGTRFKTELSPCNLLGSGLQ